MSDLQSIAQDLQKYRSEAIKITRSLGPSDLSEILQQSLNPEDSAKAIANVVLALDQIESKLYTLSIIRLEVQSALDRVPSGDASVVLVRSLKSLQAIVSECRSIVRSRYDHLKTALDGVRSINTSMRSLSKR